MPSRWGTAWVPSARDWESAPFGVFGDTQAYDPPTSYHGPPTGTGPVVPSTVAATTGAGGLIRSALPVLGQSAPAVPISGTATPVVAGGGALPDGLGPYLLNIKFPIRNGQSGGGTLFCEIDYINRADIPLLNNYRAPYRLNPNYSYGDDWFLLYSPGTSSTIPGTPVSRDIPYGFTTWYSRWFFRNAFFPGPFPGLFAGPYDGDPNIDGYDTAWTNYPARPAGYDTGATDSNWGLCGAAFPLGFDTSTIAVQTGLTSPRDVMWAPYGPWGREGSELIFYHSGAVYETWGLGADPMPEMSHPVVVVYFQTFDVVVSGLPAPYFANDNAALSGGFRSAYPQPGTFTLYNDAIVGGMTLPLTWVLTDTRVFQTSTTAFPTTGTTPIPVRVWGVGNAMYTYLDLSAI